MQEVTQKMLNQEETINFLAKDHFLKILHPVEDSSALLASNEDGALTMIEPSILDKQASGGEEDGCYFSQDVQANYVN